LLRLAARVAIVFAVDDAGLATDTAGETEAAASTRARTSGAVGASWRITAERWAFSSFRAGLTRTTARGLAAA
jgi:hypothetical protein